MATGRIRILGIEKATRMVKNIAEGIIAVPPKHTEIISKQFRKAIIESINKRDRGTHQSSGHSTPTTLRQRLVRRKMKNGYSVMFRKAESPDLPMWLDQGVRPHQIPNAFGKGSDYVVNHPGTKTSSMTGFWSEPIRKFEGRVPNFAERMMNSIMMMGKK